MSKTVRIVVAVAVGLIAIGAVTWAFFRSPSDAPLAPPAEAIRSVLELRVAGSTDTTGYTRFIESTEVASALAEDSAGKKGKRPIPEWSSIAVKESSESTASVVVTWKPSSSFKGWPKKTTFMLKKLEGAWKVVDAAVAASTESTGTVETTSAP